MHTTKNIGSKAARQSPTSLYFFLSALALASGTHELRAQSERWAYTHQMFPETTYYPSGGAAGDFDGDGDLDLYLAVETRGFPSNSAQDRLYLNDGRGRFSDATSRLPIDGDDTYGVALGDLDGDGDLDAVLANGVTPCRIYLNDGLSNFQDAPWLLPTQPLPGPLFFCVILSDFDQDGDLDVFFAGEVNRLWLNQGAYGFLDASATHLPPPLSGMWTRDVAAADIDGDGDSDLVLANLGDLGAAPNQLFLNTGSARFLDVSFSQLGSAFVPTMGVDVGDIDGDGDLDIYFSNTRNGPPGQAQDQLYINTGGGSFVETLLALPTETYSTNDAVFADFDGDGDLDVLTANGVPNGLPSDPDQILRNDGSGSFIGNVGSTSSTVELSTHRWVVGDFDNDGDIDGIAVCSIETRPFLNRGDGVLIDATNRYPWLIGGEVAAGDFDGDGILDLAALSRLPPLTNCMLLSGRGDGTFIDASTGMPNVSWGMTIAAGDMDRDGDLDLVIGTTCFSGAPCQLRILRNDGVGNFASWWTFTLTEWVASLALGDLDGDGFLDIAAGMGWRPPWVRIFLNRGASGFSEVPAAVPSDPGEVAQVALGDLDGDSDLDLFVAKTSSSSAAGFENRVYRNVGGGRFAVVSGALPPHVEPSSSVALGDIDADGDLDAMVGNGVLVNDQWVSVANRLYLNNGNAVFTDASTSLPLLPADPTLGVALFDADGDGDLDAFFSNRDPRSRLYRNNGGGQFADASSELPNMRLSSGKVTIVDIDHDGDLDICSGNLGGLVLFNLQRQLSWRTPQSLGKSFAMDLHGDPNAPWILLASPGTATIGVPPFGTLFLDPANLGITVAGSFDTQGRASFDFRVPRWRGFLGQSVYWQAVMNFPPRFSNLEITVVTDY